MRAKTACCFEEKDTSGYEEGTPLSRVSLGRPPSLALSLEIPLASSASSPLVLNLPRRSRTHSAASPLRFPWSPARLLPSIPRPSPSSLMSSFSPPPSTQHLLLPALLGSSTNKHISLLRICAGGPTKKCPNTIWPGRGPSLRGFLARAHSTHTPHTHTLPLARMASRLDAGQQSPATPNLFRGISYCRAVPPCTSFRFRCNVARITSFRVDGGDTTRLQRCCTFP